MNFCRGRAFFFPSFSLLLTPKLNFVAPSHSSHHSPNLSILFSISFCLFWFVVLACLFIWFVLIQKFLFFVQLLLATVPMLFMRSCLSMVRICECVCISLGTRSYLSHAFFAMHEWHSYGYIFIRLGRIDDEYCRSGLLN